MLVIAVDRCKRDTGKAQPANKAFRERGFSDAASALRASNESVIGGLSVLCSALVVMSSVVFSTS